MAARLFVERLVERSIRNYESVCGDGVAVYDRGVPDCVAYAMALGLDASDAMRAAERYPYETSVFVAAPWREIYGTDDMRRATFDQAEHFHTLVVSAYESLGYELLDLPRSSVEDRANFVLARVTK